MLDLVLFDVSDSTELSTDVTGPAATRNCAISTPTAAAGSRFRTHAYLRVNTIHLVPKPARYVYMHFMHPTAASLRPCAQAWSGACDAYIRTHPCVYAPDTEYSPGTVNRPNVMLSETISERYGSGYGVAVRGIARRADAGRRGSRSQPWGGGRNCGRAPRPAAHRLHIVH